jgi:hypothetical protein
MILQEDFIGGIEMTEETRKFVTDRTKELIAAPSCCPELRAEAQAWLAAAGTDAEAEETLKYLNELEEDITPIDGLIAFAGSEHAIQKLGAEAAAGMLKHAKEIKAAGAGYCDCPACRADAAILSRIADMV